MVRLSLSGPAGPPGMPGIPGIPPGIPMGIPPGLPGGPCIPGPPGWPWLFAPEPTWSDSMTRGKPRLSVSRRNLRREGKGPMASSCSEANSRLAGRPGSSRTGPTMTPTPMAAFWMAALAWATTTGRESLSGSILKSSISFWVTWHLAW